MVIAINPNQVRDYVLKAERQADGSPVPGATVFKLRSVSLAVRARFTVLLGLASNKAPGGSGLDLLSQVPPQDLVDMMLDVLRAALCGWSNLADASGSQVVFETEDYRINGQLILGAPTNRTLDCLPPEAAQELSDEAMLGMIMTRADKKN